MSFRVAVIDDEEGVRALLTRILGARGYAVDEYATCTSAREGLFANPPDLIICDVELPDGNGLELISSIHAGDGAKIPAIVLSGMKAENDFVRGFAAGAVDYLAKPFSAAELLARCAIHLGRQGRAPQVEQELENDGIPMQKGLAFGRYKIEGVLGRGGYGIVYRARDESRAGGVAALKVLSAIAGADEEARLRFLRETYALAAVRHASVVGIFDLGTQAGRLYYAMELVEGETLRGHVTRAGPLGEASARAVLRGLADALVALEEARVLHRDLKPDNVILRKGDVSQPVLVDFGLAKRSFDRAVTNQDFLVGTPGFMAPEVIAGRDPDPRSDLFSLGLTLREAMTGEDLFPDLRGNDLLTAIMNGPIPLPDVPMTDALRTILARLLAIAPEQRTPSARALLAELDAG